MGDGSKLEKGRENGERDGERGGGGVLRLRRRRTKEIEADSAKGEDFWHNSYT